MSNNTVVGFLKFISYITHCGKAEVPDNGVLCHSHLKSRPKKYLQPKISSRIIGRSQHRIPVIRRGNYTHRGVGDFPENLSKLEENKDKQNPICFFDANQQHCQVVGCLKINGAFDIKRVRPVVRFDDKINVTSTGAFFRQLNAANPQPERIRVIANNARYNRSKKVGEYLKESKFALSFYSLIHQI